MDQLPPPSPQRDVKPAVPSSVKVKAEPKAKKNEDADLLDFHLGRSDSSDSGSESASDDDDFVPEKRGSADSSRSGSKRGAGRASRRTMDDSDDSESDNSLPAPRRLKKARGTAKQGPVKKEATLKRKGPVSDDDDEDEPVKHRSSKRMVVADSDDESPRAVPRRHVVPDELQRRPINLDRHLKSLYRLAGSKQAVEAMPHFESMKNLLQKLEDINLPDNALDHLVMALGGPDEVAELTGRKIRAVVSPSGRIVFEKRYGPGTGKTLENMNLREKEQFMNGHKNVAIISDAASAGISLQADKRVPNQRRRVHITLELAWAADKTVQQLGRTHRSNQSSAPEYVLMISDVAGENRFASSVAKRLGSMGALTKGDRKASTGINLTQFNHETRFGRLALEKTYAAIGSSYHQSNYQSSTKALKPDVLPPNMTQQEFFATLQEYMDKLDMAQNDSDMSNVPKNPIFSYFQQQLRAVLSWARKHNKLDKGIEPVGGLYETLALAPGKPVRTVYQDPYTKLETRYLEIVTDRGISFEVANAILQDTENPGPRDGFYVISYEFSSIKHYVLAIEVANDQFKRRSPWHIPQCASNCWLLVYKPNIGEIFTLEPWDKTLMRNGKKIKADKMKPLWTERYKFAETKCQHKLGPSGKCSIERVGGHCDHGVRLRRHHLFCGGTMSIWRLVEHAMSYNSGKQRLKIVRTSGENDTVKAIGLAVPSNAVARVLDTLEKQAELDKLKGPGVKLEAYYY
ncbi:hypothetical protein DFJ74DRAFT_333212 [Hyaloraphidium curvatum]|nr:hypothetical protein DFJ74DRAFT_333212 [Hyaloraphidium curvatum]